MALVQKEVKAVYMWVPRLPTEYQEVEYIQSTGTQWIDTWLFASTNMQTETKIEVTTTEQDKPVFWCFWPWSYVPHKYYHLTPYNYKWYYWLNNWEWNAWTYSPTVWTQYTLVYNDSWHNLLVNGTSVWSVSGTVGFSWSTLTISRRWASGSTSTDHYWQFKYFYFKMYDNSTNAYVRDFVPCYRKSDWVIGMYDLVTSTFYTNSWTGTFTKWNDVNTLVEKKVRPTTLACLCFTANTANSTVKLEKVGSPTTTSLETSTDWSTWSDYTIWSTITLSSVGDKVYMRNKSETPTGFSTGYSHYYRFNLSGSISASWDVTYLLCKDGTDTLQSDYCFYDLFYSNSALITAPSLPATTLTTYCYSEMFYHCQNLTTLTALPATTLPNSCYSSMFLDCSKIKLSETQTWEYQTPYRIPTEWTGADGYYSLSSMFSNTGGTAYGTLSINTTYYTSNTVV